MLVNIAPFNEEKKVCIIVPVYNAQKYLGYCLNSILSQSYTNWTAILVDDGSTDSSLEICRHYASIDHRFQVISKANGGVSSARNAGLAAAEGDYLEFLDSDDCLAQDTLEKQVKLAAEYHSQLVLMDIMMVDFSNPNLDRIMLSSAWLKQSPCLLSAEEFKEKRMQLVWHTVLLECLHAKLYDLSLWKSLGLTFPEELSLGEDFVTNMKYFEACNNAVFLQECGHYYNCIMGSSSLTQKYRPDLFEIKMYLIEKLEEHLGGRENLSAQERDALYCYAASNGLSCVEKAILDSGMREKKLIERLQEMFAHPVFSESLFHASYIPDRFVACIKPIKEKDLKEVIRYIADGDFAAGTKETAKAAEPVSAPVTFKSSLLNRAIRKLLRMAGSVAGHGVMGERFARWEREIAQQGLRLTYSAHAHAHKRVTNNQLERQTQQLEQYMDWRICGVYNRVDERCNTLDQYAAAVSQKIENTAAQLQTVDEKIATSADMIRTVDEKIAVSTAMIQQNVNGYIWDSEQRMLKYSYQRDINELRQRKKAIMIATAEHANIGDAAITLAEQQILSKQFPEYFQVEISTYEFARQEAYLHAILNPEDIIFIHGGGNLGDLYSVEEELHQKIVSEFPNNKIVIFPQTICFSQLEGELFKKALRIYNNHQDLTLFVRGGSSLEFARQHFGQVNTILMTDSVHALSSHYCFERSGVLLCLRTDSEGILDTEKKDHIEKTARSFGGIVDSVTNMHNVDISRDIRGLVVRKELMRFAQHQVVITDRLHGMIFSAVTGTPCVVLASFNHKIREYFEAFFRDSNAVFFIGDDISQLEAAVNQAMQVKQPHYPILEKSPLDSIRTNAKDL